MCKVVIAETLVAVKGSLYVAEPESDLVLLPEIVTSVPAPHDADEEVV
jgi:hypothetical protein